MVEFSVNMSGEVAGVDNFPKNLFPTPISSQITTFHVGPKSFYVVCVGVKGVVVIVCFIISFLLLFFFGEGLKLKNCNYVEHFVLLCVLYIQSLIGFK